jgi:hypothetical protein
MPYFSACLLLVLFYVGRKNGNASPLQTSCRIGTYPFRTPFINFSFKNPCILSGTGFHRSKFSAFFMLRQSFFFIKKLYSFEKDDNIDKEI